MKAKRDNQNKRSSNNVPVIQSEGHYDAGTKDF
jgi:hypothetical protein